MKRLLVHLLIWTVRVCATIPLLWLWLFLQFQPEGSGGFSEAVHNAMMFTAWSVLHSLMARDIFKQRISRAIGSEWVRAFYVIICGITLAAVLYFWNPLSGMFWSAHGAGYWILTLLFVACVGASFYIARYFDTAEFIGIRSHLRKLKNKPPKPQRFSAEGPYAYCRHPMYIFLIASFWVGPAMTVGRFEFALLGTLYAVIGTFFEERNLMAELGAEYKTYRANVPMWIPRLRPWVPNPSRNTVEMDDTLPGTRNKSQEHVIAS